MTRSLVMAVALQLACASAAFSCDGQSGASIFEDRFADDSGGWDMSAANIKIVPPAMQLALSKDVYVASSLNLTFNANNGNYCQDVVFPAAIPGNPMRAGIQFWAVDPNNLFLFLAGDDGNSWLYKKVNGAWSVIFSAVPIEGFNTTPGAAHSIMVQAKGGTLTLSVDGKTVKAVRAQMPPGPLQFGIYAEATQAVDPPESVQITGFSVTAGQ